MGRGLMVKCSPFRGAVRALVDDESSDNDSNDAEIQGTALLVYQQRSEEEMMDQEDAEVDTKLLPDHKNLFPLEIKSGIIDRTQIETEHWHCEEHSPQCQIGQILMSFLFFHPSHIT
jgi:hypothetical protein